MRRTAWMIGLVGLFVASPALAQERPAPAPARAPASGPEHEEDTNEEEPKDHNAYVSISPLHLLLPVVEVTAEVRLHEKMGIAAIGGYGSIDPDQVTRGTSSPRYTVWELGGQLVGYPVGHFDHGMQLGAEVLYLGVSGSSGDSQTRVAAGAQGLAMGPFVGYKLTTGVGFSFNVQGGVQYVTARAQAQSSGGAASASDSAVIPLVNLNVGWAF